MSPCPSWEQLRDLLDELRVASEHDLVEDHVSATARWREVVRDDGHDHGSGPVLDVLRQLKDADPPIPGTPHGWNRMTETEVQLGSERSEGEQEPDWPTVGGYEIRGELGQGGMGVVSRAFHRRLGRQVALKMIQSSSRALPEQLTRFETEARAVARLDHNDIIQISETGAADRATNGAEDLPDCVLELLEGGSLSNRLAGTPQPGRTAAELVVTLARAIHAAHQAGIVHRDLKPSNVLFTKDGTPKITDFGLAKLVEEESQQTVAGELLGSPSSMAPEQARGNARAACLARLGDVGGAERERGAAESLPPVTAFDQFLTGQERYERGRWDEALHHFDAVLRHQPNHFWAQCLSAICFLQLQRPLEAKASLNACLNQDPDFAWLYLLRGFASGQVGAIFAQAGGVAAQPSSLLGKAEDHFAAAEEDYARALELLERKPVAELRYVLLVNRGLLRWQRRDLDQAVADLQEAIRLDARLYQAHAGLAQVLRQQGKPDEAVEQFTQAIALRPDLAALYRGRAEVYRGHEDLTPARIEAALHDLDEAVRRESPANPVLALDHTNRARLLERAGRHAEALAACDAALRAVPDHAEAHRLRIGVLLMLKRYDEVIASCDAVLRDRPTAEVFELRGLAKDRRKDFSGAIADYTQALAQHRDQPRLWNRRGWAHLVTNAVQLALADFERALRLDASDSDALSGRGLARVLLGQHRAAVADAEESLRHGAPDARRYYIAGRIYVRAASAAANEVRKAGRAAVALTASYQDRAVALIREAVRRTPLEQRAAFVRDQVFADPALRPIIRRLKFDELDEHTAALTR